MSDLCLLYTVHEILQVRNKFIIVIIIIIIIMFYATQLNTLLQFHKHVERFLKCRIITHNKFRTIIISHTNIESCFIHNYWFNVIGERGEAVVKTSLSQVWRSISLSLDQTIRSNG